MTHPASIPSLACALGWVAGRGYMSQRNQGWQDTGAATAGGPTCYWLAIAPVALLWLLLLLAAPVQAGEIAYDLIRPTTSDSASCGANDAPLNDLDHYLIRLYRCRTDSLVRRTPPLKPLWIARRDSFEFTVPATKDSVRFYDLPDGMQGWIQVWPVDRSGNVSCDYRSDTWRTPALPGSPPPPPPDTSTTGIKGTYFIGQSRNTYAGEWRDGPIDFNWGLGAAHPGMPVDGWSVEWLGKLVIPTTGTYTLYVEVQSGAQLTVDGTMRIDRLGDFPLTEYSATWTMAAGEHVLDLVYTARTGNAAIALKWLPPGGVKQVIPRGALK